MSILKQNTNLPSTLKTNSSIKNKQKDKTNDFIFKRYRYEENNILTNHQSNIQKMNHKQYLENNKDPQLQKYKQELQNQVNHFDIISVEQNQDQNQNQQNLSNVNKFQSDQKPSLKKQKQLTENVNQANPMELIDFQNDQEQQIEQQGSEQESDQVTQFEYCKPFKSSQQQGKQKNKDKSQNQNQKINNLNISSFSHASSALISPNQTLDGTNLQQSSCLFIKKGKQKFVQSHNFKKSKKQQQQNIFNQNQIIQFPKYEIKKLTEKDNPFKDALSYSNQKQQLKGIKIHSVPFNQQVNIQIYDKDLFVSSKIPPGIILKCKLKRSSGFFNLMNPQYDLYLQNGLKHIISAKKNSFRNRQLFYLSTKMNNFQNPIRSLMANVLHNVYWLVDKPKTIQRKKISYLDLLIQYKKFDEKNKKQREILVLCPPELQSYHIGLEYDIPSIDFQWFKQNIALQLHNKHKSYVPVTKNSQKNFALIDSDDQNDDIIVESNSRQALSGPLPSQKFEEGKVDNSKYLYVRMQKQSQNIFDIEIQHPLTPLQAMAIILTRFDAQLK